MMVPKERQVVAWTRARICLICPRYPVAERVIQAPA